MSNDSNHNPNLERALALYREARSPNDAVHERVWSAVDANVNAPTGGGESTPSAAQGPGIGGKLAALAGVAAIGATVWWLATPNAPTEAPAPPPREPVATPAIVPPTPPTQPSVEAIAPSVEAVDPIAEQPALPIAIPAEPARRTTEPAKPASTLAAELRLMTAAQAALDANEPRRALRLLEQHARRHAQGALTEEREAARVEALCGVGRSDAARRAAERFATSFAGSPRIARVTSLCAEATP